MLCGNSKENTATSSQVWSGRFTGLATSCWNSDVTEPAQQKNTDHTVSACKVTLRSEEAHGGRAIPICRQGAAHSSSQTLPPLLYRCAWSSAVNTYAGAKDALNIVEAWIRKREEKKKPQQISPHSTSTVLLTMSTVNPLTLKITYTWSIKKKIEWKKRVETTIQSPLMKIKNFLNPFIDFKNFHTLKL